MKLVARSKKDQNRAALDPWTVVHFGNGLAMGLMDVPRRWSLVAAVTYEVLEQVVERQEWGQEVFATSRPESAANALFDVAVFAAGHWLGARWNRRARRK